MIFTEPRFLAFFLVVFGAYWLLRNHAQRKLWLLAASLFFYGCWDVRFLALILGCATVDFVAANRIARARSNGGTGRAWLVFSLVYDLGTLGFFKYCNFFLESATQLLAWLGLPVHVPTLQIVLPVGISFFTFQAMSYALDIYRGHLVPAKSYTDFLLFVTFFPQLVAGPIVRASDFLPQLDTKKHFADVDVHRALGQFLSGFVKKALVADLIAQPVDAVFGAPHEYTALSIVAAVVCYAIQIYCDFSGYSDMAIGCARLFGFELCENFRFPYLARDITELWRRWHVSLSSWLRDYLYISLGGSRGSRWFTYRNVMLTMLLGGLWHGAGWNYVAWGGVHGVALVVHREWERLRLPRVGPWLGWFLTQYTFLIGLIFFRGISLPAIGTMLHAWFLFDSPGTREVRLWSGDGDWSLWLRLPAVVLPLALAHWLTSRELPQGLRRRLPPLVVTCAYGAAFAAVLSLMPRGAKPFVYFQF
ncbi:MAG: MBOAT family protein [Planctomycetes bacterium]|nr:MBOAT family protein [Planctomycetota bacterium]